MSKSIKSIIFNSSYSPGVSKAEPKCPRELQDYTYDKSSRTLKPTKKIELYKEIQSYYESTRLDLKLKKYAMGDSLALGVPGGSFGDFADIPTNLAQVLGAKDSAQAAFNKLPSDIRELFGNDFTEFIRSVENGTYQQRLIEYATTKAGGEPASGGESVPAPNPDNGGNN